MPTVPTIRDASAGHLRATGIALGILGLVVLAGWYSNSPLLTSFVPSASPLVATAALEFICIDYLGSINDLGRVKAWGLDKVLKLVEEAFPEANLTLEMGDASETDAAA